MSGAKKVCRDTVEGNRDRALTRKHLECLVVMLPLYHRGKEVVCKQEICSQNLHHAHKRLCIPTSLPMILKKDENLRLERFY